MMRPCIFILGTRAQLVKVAPVLREAVESGLPHCVWFSGQHRESISDLIADFALQSSFVMPETHEEKSSIKSLVAWVPRMLRDSRRYLLKQAGAANAAPLVVVHGDTLTTFLAALAAKLSAGDVVHLESGLSSKSLLDPFPEELLRRMTFRLTRYALCPNPEAVAIMQRFRGCKVVNTFENTLLDSVRYALANNARAACDQEDAYFVASVHRFQNLYQSSRLTRLVLELVQISRRGKVYFVLHPPTARRLKETGLIEKLQDGPSIRLIPRLPYTRFLTLLANARGVFTDGGSNQEELSYLGVPAILFRTCSERPDGLGSNIRLIDEIDQTLDEFITSGGLDAIRQPARTGSKVFPSAHVVKMLRDWATLDS
ncbi:MAG: UDP-N-acetylglucosamine 2-epimerase [Methylococcales bacterium]